MLMVDEDFAPRGSTYEASPRFFGANHGLPLVKFTERKVDGPCRFVPLPLLKSPEEVTFLTCTTSDICILL